MYPVQQVSLSNTIVTNKAIDLAAEIVFKLVEILEV